MHESGWTSWRILKNKLIWRFEVRGLFWKTDVSCGTQVHAISLWMMMTTLLWTRPLWLSSRRICLWSSFGIWWDKLQRTVAFASASLPVGFFKILQCTRSTKLFNNNSSIFHFFLGVADFSISLQVRETSCLWRLACKRWAWRLEVNASWFANPCFKFPEVICRELWGVKIQNGVFLFCWGILLKPDFKSGFPFCCPLNFLVSSFRNLRRSFVVSSSEKVCKKLHSEVWGAFGSSCGEFRPLKGTPPYPYPRLFFDSIYGN